MNPARNTKPGLWVKAIVFSVVLLTTSEVQAENWIEVRQGQVWYDSDYSFIDRETGFVVVEIAQFNNDGTYSYFLDALDCLSWVVHVLGKRDVNGNYEIYPYWKTDERFAQYMPQGTNVDRVARQVCPNRYYLPYDDIPQ